MKERDQKSRSKTGYYFNNLFLWLLICGNQVAKNLRYTTFFYNEMF